jgi:imidazolonepropionase-like amidohydrolase
MGSARLLAVLAVVGLSIHPAARPNAAQAATDPVILTADRLFDGRALHEGPVEILVRRGRIEAVSVPGAHGAPRFDLPDAERIDLSGHTQLPGFIDAHTHLT